MTLDEIAALAEGSPFKKDGVVHWASPDGAAHSVRPSVGGRISISLEVSADKARALLREAGLLRMPDWTIQREWGEELVDYHADCGDGVDAYVYKLDKEWCYKIWSADGHVFVQERETLATLVDAQRACWERAQQLMRGERLWTD